MAELFADMTAASAQMATLVGQLSSLSRRDTVPERIELARWPAKGWGWLVPNSSAAGFRWWRPMPKLLYDGAARQSDPGRLEPSLQCCRCVRCAAGAGGAGHGINPCITVRTRLEQRA